MTLKKWIQNVGETPLTAEQAEEEYARSEKGLRFQRRRPDPPLMAKNDSL